MLKIAAQSEKTFFSNRMDADPFVLADSAFRLAEANISNNSFVTRQLSFHSHPSLLHVLQSCNSKLLTVVEFDFIQHHVGTWT